ncbi:DUF4184 family protein [Streptomyces sp. NPDC057445]|uniref:DUF4184 family protein n=1 Tax=Streptomyces sp. NPDC057445 TaxID=3346136 RepID=UPI003689EBFB
MPFTLSHAAAVLPGIRRNGTARGPLFASALVAGSFAPDMTYFAASVRPSAMEFGSVTHAPVGVLTVDAVISGVLVGLWLIVREPLVALLPGGWRGRVYAFVRGRAWSDRPPAVAVLWFYVSAVLGATTHVVWDAFTHFDRWGVRMLPVLSEVVAGFPLYTYTQYGGSALALVGVVWFMASSLRRMPTGAPARAEVVGVPVGMPLPVPTGVPVLGRGERWAAAALIVGCVLAGTAHRCVRWYLYWGRIDSPLDIVPTACFGAGAGLAAGILLYGAAVRVRMRRSATAVLEADTKPDTDAARARHVV